MNGKGAGRPRRTIIGGDEMKWNEINEMEVEKLWNEICGRGRWEKLRKKNRDSVSFTTNLSWSDRDVNSGPQRWEASA